MPPALVLMMKNLSPCRQLMYCDRPGGPQVTDKEEQLECILNRALQVHVFLFALNQAGWEGFSVLLDLVNLPHLTNCRLAELISWDFSVYECKKEKRLFQIYLLQHEKNQLKGWLIPKITNIGFSYPFQWPSRIKLVTIYHSLLDYKI